MWMVGTGYIAACCHLPIYVTWYVSISLRICWNVCKVHSIVKLQCGFWSFGFWGLRVFGFAKRER